MRTRMFSIVDMGEKMEVSKVVFWSNFANMLFLTKLAVHYYTKDDEFNIAAPSAADFKQLGEVEAKMATYTKEADGTAKYTAG